jgi:hypothetical protein
MSCKTFNACRNEDRFTPNRLANARSGGSLQPGTNFPSEIKFLKLEINWTVMS